MNEGTGTQNRQTELHPWQQCAVFLLACAIVVTRRPDAIFHAQFWAEDGRIFFADAYNFGWLPALFRTYDGYFHAVPRLAASLALLAPLPLAPLVMNVIAVAVEALPVNLLLSVRSSAWGSLGIRALLAAAYLALPNCAEVRYGITESQWLLALCLFFAVVADAPRSKADGVFDLALIVLSGLSGPFCIFLFPAALFLALKRRIRWLQVRAGVLAVCSLIQGFGLLVLDPGGRSKVPLGASPAILIRILGGQVVLGALFGRSRVQDLPGAGVFVLVVCALLVGAAVVASCYLKSTVQMRLFFAFAAVIFAASRPHQPANRQRAFPFGQAWSRRVIFATGSSRRLSSHGRSSGAAAFAARQSGLRRLPCYASCA